MSEYKDNFKQIISKFSTDLYSKIIEENSNENFIISPFSIQVLLAMIHSGTKGETAEEISKVLQSHSEIDLHYFKEILDDNVNNEQLYMANKLYGQIGNEFLDEFTKITKEYFHSETENIDFTKPEETMEKINNWIESKTTGKIRNTVKEDKIPTNANLALVNSIYLKANWFSKFHKKTTYKADFLNNDSETIKVKMMNVYAGKYDYCELEELNAKALVRPYENEHLKILFIVPNENSNMTELEKNIKKINLFDICNKMKSTLVRLHVPKFTIDSEYDLEELLSKIGITKLFGDQPNFTKSIVSKDPIKITKVIHKVYFDVNEEGTEAVPPRAADFNICIYPCKTCEEPKEFFLHRPFLYAVKDDKAIYYFGRMKVLNAVSLEEDLKYIPLEFIN